VEKQEQSYVFIVDPSDIVVESVKQLLIFWDKTGIVAKKRIDFTCAILQKEHMETPS
jgi:hypothetical protein